MGYLKRIPRVVVQEGLFGSTIVRIRSRYASGEEKSFTEAQIAEALCTNRTFIAGVGSVPTTNPTSFAGQSSLLVLAPIWHRNKAGHRILNLRSLATFIEAMFKGSLARILHMSKLGVGTLAGGGKFFFLHPEHQVAIKEGETPVIGTHGLKKPVPVKETVLARGEPRLRPPPERTVKIDHLFHIHPLKGDLSLRKLLRISCPSGVRMDSGWN